MINNIKIDNFEMRYFKFGHGTKNMVIIPGVNMNSVMKLENLIIDAYNIFESDFSVYVFDRITKMEKSYDVYDMASDLIKALDYLKLDNLYLFGTSQGGMIAEVIAIKRPDLIYKLNINSTVGYVDNNEYKIFNNLINLCNENKIYDAVDLLAQNIYSANLYNNIKNTLNDYAKSLSKLDINNFIVECEALNNFNVLNDLSNIKCSTLIIASKKDKIFDYHKSIELNDKIKNSRLYLYDDYSHTVYDEATDFKKIVYDFFME